MVKSLGKVWVEIQFRLQEHVRWLHDTVHLATVTLQESRYFGGFVKGGPKSSLRLFLHQALQL